MKSFNHLVSSRSLAFVGMALSFGFVSAQAAVEISYDEPRKFSDMGDDSPMFDRSMFERFQRAMQKTADSLAEKYLPADSTLVMKFTDVDLAGEVEPWATRTGEQIRIVREIYPPRLKFHYTVKDADGEVLDEGLAQLTDMNFLWGANRIRQSETFYYEVQLLEDWGRKVLDGVGVTSEPHEVSRES